MDNRVCVLLVIVVVVFILKLPTSPTPTPTSWNNFEQAVSYKYSDVCEPTRDYFLFESQIISRKKKVGGDEFYVEALDAIGNTVAVAAVNDLLNGRYNYSWIPLKTSFFTHVKLTTQYFCGKGFLFPPAKKNWTDGGSKIKSFLYNFSGHVYYTKTEFPRIESLNTVAYGDSLMEQFVNDQSVVFKKVQSRLTKTTLVSKFIKPIELLLKKNDKSDKIILNSGVWDLLENYKDVAFSQHTHAMEELLTHIQRNHPTLQIIWKSMTAVHVHRCMCKTTQCSDRIKYMSSSRAKMLYSKQKKLLQKNFPTILFLDMYDYTFANANSTKILDGRHYQKSFNKKIWNRFFT